MSNKEFAPYKKQHEFLRHKGNKVLYGGNRVGKTSVLMYESCLHASGKYPHWWSGQEYGCQVNILVVCQNLSVARDTVWPAIMGMVEGSRRIYSDSIEIKHVNGGMSTITVVSAETSSEHLKGRTFDIAVFDDCGDEHDFESTSNGITAVRIIAALTPFKASSGLYEPEFASNRGWGVFNMSLFDASHFSKDDYESMLGLFEPGTKDFNARIMGRHE